MRTFLTVLTCPAMEPVERMNDRDRAVARLLADAGIRSVAHLDRIVEVEHPELRIDRVTVHRYLYDPPRKMDFRVVTALAKALGVSAETFVETVSAKSSLARYIGHAIARTSFVPDHTLALAVG